MVSPTTQEISQLGQVIGELRNFAAQQAITNSHMLDELKKISERMSSFGEVGATFIEYRKTLHERFNKIHEQFGAADERLDKLEVAQAATDKVITAAQAQLKTFIGLGMVSCTVISSLLATYGGALLKVLASAGPP